MATKRKRITKRSLERSVLRLTEDVHAARDEIKKLEGKLREMYDERHLLQHEVDAYRTVNQVRPDIIKQHGGLTCLPGCNQNPCGK